MKYLGVLLNPLLKDDDDIQKQAKSLYCAANKLRGTIDQFSSAVKNTLFRAYIACMQGVVGWESVGTALPHLFALVTLNMCDPNDYAKTWLRSRRCASET